MNNHRLPRVALVLAAAFILPAAPAAAWNASGHMIISLLAYNLMNEATRQQAVALLHAHPRYVDHFERPMQRDVAGAPDAEQDQWLFAYASTWPDVVRSADGGVTREDVQQFNRPWWHFVNEPLYLSDAEQAQLEPTVRFNRRRDPPDGDDDPDMNVIQAIKNSARIVGDQAAAPAIRSVHLCWLLHLVGDSHQPLHSSSLVTRRRFPEGDRGGNLLHADRDFPLHAFWDSQVSIDEQYHTLQRLATSVGQNAQLAAAGKEAAASLDPGTWIDEGRELARQYVYTPEVLQKIADREGHTHLGELRLSPQYEAAAETVAERQAIVAAHRLAVLLEHLLP
jgi:hypothetical protein